MKKFKEWFENYWYYHKWHTIFGVFFIIFAVVIIIQLTKRETVDSNILYAGPRALTSEQIGEIEAAFAQFTDDFDKDGNKNVVLTDIVMLTDEDIKSYREEAKEKGEVYTPDGEYIKQEREKYSMEISAGDCYICLISPNVYALENANGTFMSLDELGISGIKSEDGTAVVFKTLPFASSTSVFEAFPDDTLIVFRRLGASAKAKGKSEEETFENQKKVFRKVLNFENN